MTGGLLVAVQRARASLPSLTADNRARVASLVRDLHDVLFDPSRRPDESVEAALEPAHALTYALDQLEAPATQAGREAPVAALIRPADRHAEDAKSLEARMAITIVLAGVCTLGLAGLGIWVTVSPPQSWPGPAIVAVSLGVAAVALGWNSRRLDIEAQELRRVSRQLEMLPPFMAGLPDTTQGLLRGALIQRLFPRLISDSDPLREGDWAPNSKEMLLSLDRSYLEYAMGPDDDDSDAYAGEEEQTPTLQAEGAGDPSAPAIDPADSPSRTKPAKAPVQP